MRIFVHFFAIGAILTVTATDAAAQLRGTISGQVIDESTREALAGAQVHIPGTNISTLTNQRGQYVLLNVPEGPQTVRIVLIGYAQAEQVVNVAGGETVAADFGLRVSAIAFDELVVSVVTGEAQRKRELGTNTATIGAREIERAPITKMADVLTARTPGVQLQGVAGSLGTSQRIRIRGANSISLSNEPLIYIDGVQASNSTDGMAVGGQDYSRLNDLNPDDISSVEILKGPAASALYGTAAANGVILITTRRGHSGDAQWRAYAEVGASEDRNTYPTNFLPYQIDDPAEPVFTDGGSLNSDGYTYCPNVSVAADACTQDEILSLNPFNTPGLNPLSTGNRQKYGVSVSGGRDAVTYYLSSDVENERGVISLNKQDKVNLRANLDARVSDRLTLSVNSGYTKANLALNQNDNNIFSPLINAFLASPFVPTQEQREALPPQQRAGAGFGFYMSDIEEIITRQEVDRFIVNSAASYTPLSWLSLNANVGMDYFGRDDEETVQPGRLPIAATFTPGFREASKASNYVWTANAAGVATYPLNDDLSATTTLGGSYTHELFENIFCGGVGILEGSRSCTAASSLFEVDEEFSELRRIGGYLQHQFGWRDRLFVAGSIRGDDDSAFGQDFGLVYYPGASASWVISEEPFFPEIGFLSNLRLRSAFGTSGLRPEFRDAITLLEPVAVASDNQELPAVALNRVGNPDLKPERTSEFELGFDAGLLNDRVSVAFTYFNKRSKDALISRPLPPSAGLTGDVNTSGTIFDNIGEVRNWGTELAIDARILNREDATLNVRLANTTLDNRIEELGEGVQPIIFNRNGVQAHKEGFPLGAFFGQRYEIGEPNEQGLLGTEDITLVDDTAVYLGNVLPKNTQLLSGDLTLFGSVTISTLFERRAGNMQLNDTERFRCTTGFNRGGGGGGAGQCVGVADPNASLFEQGRFVAQRFHNVTTGYIEKADFIKWRELSVSFQLPQSLTAGSPLLDGATLTLSGRNLKTWTDYTGIDPEVNETGGDANFTQGEFNTQPQVRYYTIRLNVAF